jgi:hypothetical protein
MDRSHYAEADGAHLKRSWASRIKAKVKLRSREQSPAGVTSSLASSIIVRSVSAGLPTTSSLSDTSTQTNPDTAKHISTIATEHSNSKNNGGPDTLPRPNLWLKAYEVATLDTRKWIESLPGLDVPSQGSDKGEQLWTEDLVAIVKGLERQHQDNAHRIMIGQKEIFLRDYAISTVTWLTMIGDIAIQFAPPPSAIIWPAIKALLQVRCPSIFSLSRLN